MSHARKAKELIARTHPQWNLVGLPNVPQVQKVVNEIQIQNGSKPSTANSGE